MHTHLIPCQKGEISELFSDINYLEKIKAGSREYHSLEKVNINGRQEKTYIPYKNVFFDLVNGGIILKNTIVRVLDMLYFHDCEENKEIAQIYMFTPPRQTCHQGSLPLFGGDLIHYKLDEEYLIPMHGIYDGNKNNTGIGLRHEEYYGFYYIANEEKYKALLDRVQNNNVKAISFDESPKLHEFGFWYNENIILE